MILKKYWVCNPKDRGSNPLTATKLIKGLQQTKLMKGYQLLDSEVKRETKHKSG